TIYCNATHLGDILWIQWYERFDSNFLSTAYNLASGAQNVQTAGAGATVLDVYDCLTAANPGGSQVGFQTNVADGMHHIFLYGFNNGFNPGQYLITSITSDGLRSGAGCHVGLDRSPSPAGPGGVYPN